MYCIDKFIKSEEELSRKYKDKVERFEKRLKNEYQGDVTKMLFGYRRKLGIFDRIKRYIPRIKINDKTLKRYLFERLERYIIRLSSNSVEKIENLESVEVNPDINGGISEMKNYFVKISEKLDKFILLTKCNGKYVGLILEKRF